MSASHSELDLERAIGRAFMFGFPGAQPSEGILRMIREDHLGGVILFSRNIASREQVRELCLALQEEARAAGHDQPLLIATDQENGLVRRLGPDSPLFPGNMALGAIGSDSIAFDVAYYTGRELLALGVNMNLAPVVDVNNNPTNPVIGIRSFGEDPELVARLGAATVRGFADAGVISSLKHFPGHGDTGVDSHLALPTIAADRERLDAVELIPFRRGIAVGADTVLMGHMRVPALEAGEAPPASVSPAIITSLLREELGFSGVVVTDCLEMDAISRGVGVAQGSVRALAAGADLVLVSHRQDRQMAALSEARAALRSGRLDPARIREAIGRLRDLKARRLSWERSLNPPPASSSLLDTTSLRNHAYARSTTLVRDTAALLPLRLEPGQRLLVLDWPAYKVWGAVDIPFDSEPFVSALRERQDAVEVVALPAVDDSAGRESARRRIEDAAVVIALTLNAHLDPERAALLRELLDGKRQVIGVAVCNPYDAAALPTIPTYLLTYDYSAPALRAAAEVLTSARAPSGVCPVTLSVGA